MFILVISRLMLYRTYYIKEIRNKFIEYMKVAKTDKQDSDHFICRMRLMIETGL